MLHDALLDESAMAISDGSYKDTLGTASWTIGDPNIDGLKESWLQRLSLQYVKSDQATAQIIAQRYLAASPCLETLLKLPEDSLGYHYATHLISLNFDPNFYRSIQVNSDTDYLLLRLRQTHDIWHIVTGFGVDVTGELQLKAFELSQTRRPLAIVLLLGGLFGALFSSSRFYSIRN